jgi:putative tryptophan/tyrosine transport system substrate-binding protein
MATRRQADEPGVLASYSIDSRQFLRRAAELGERILKGAKPGHIPMEQPEKYNIVVNLATARALGMEIPPAVLARATKVIE